MKARAELEVYRRFAGKLRSHPLRFWPITASNVRVTTKKRRAVTIFYVPPAIAMIVGCFLVYLKFAGEEALQSDQVPSDALGAPIQLIAMQATQFLEVRNRIFAIMTFLTGWSLLASIWFGSGLLCEDKRVGAHLLYFTRPITRLDYFLGKFLTFAILSGIVVFVPGIVMCIYASFSSPEWSFLKEEWDLFLRVTAYAAVWVLGIGAVTLCISSIASRRVFALIGTFAFFLFSQGVAQVLGHVVDKRLFLVSVLDDLQVVAMSLFEQPMDPDRPSVGACYAAVLVLSALALFVVSRRIRSWEVVG